MTLREALEANRRAAQRFGMPITEAQRRLLANVRRWDRYAARARPGQKKRGSPPG